MYRILSVFLCLFFFQSTILNAQEIEVREIEDVEINVQAEPDSLGVTTPIKYYSWEECDVKPTFAGENLMNFRVWVLKNVSYPKEARKKGIHGRVIVRFIINTEGEVSEMEVISSPHHSLSEAVVEKIAQRTQDCTPGEMDGEPVYVEVTVPFDFKLIK